MPAETYPPAPGFSVRPVLTGVAIAAGAVAVSALLARSLAPPEDSYEVYSDYDAPAAKLEKPQRKLFGLVWAPAFLVLTLSGLRLWFAPRSRQRTEALTLWGLTQAINAVWMALGPARLGGRLATAVASLGAAGAYAWRAHRVDLSAARMAAPYLAWLPSTEAKPAKVTVH
ncbi:TspO/MBR family protein [Phenylobacterium sp.]|jgi:tryptophan-rich sensory protein|uniref:TspO/MBR family protein n=1 Tax=Phenylobacterium sp. TaxID=1871053 RepID=UPI002F91C41A